MWYRAHHRNSSFAATSALMHLVLAAMDVVSGASNLHWFSIASMLFAWTYTASERVSHHCNASSIPGFSDFAYLEVFVFLLVDHIFKPGRLDLLKDILFHSVVNDGADSPFCTEGHTTEELIIDLFNGFKDWLSRLLHLVLDIISDHLLNQNFNGVTLLPLQRPHVQIPLPTPLFFQSLISFHHVLQRQRPLPKWWLRRFHPFP